MHVYVCQDETPVTFDQNTRSSNRHDKRHEV